MSEELKSAVATLVNRNADTLLIGVNKDRTGIFSVRETNQTARSTATGADYEALSKALFTSAVFREIIANRNVTWILLRVKDATLTFRMGDRESTVDLFPLVSGADLSKPVMYLNPTELFFLLFKRYPDLGNVFNYHDKQMVGIIDVITGHAKVFPKKEFVDIYRKTFETIVTAKTKWGNDPYVCPAGGVLFKRVGPKLTLHRMQAIATYDITILTVAKGNLGFLHANLDGRPNPEALAWIESLNSTDANFLIQSIYERPFTAGVVNQLVPRPDGVATKDHPLHVRAERRVLMSGGAAPVAVSIDRTYM